MAVIHGKNLDHKLFSTAVEDDTLSVDVNIDNDIVDASAAGDTAKETLEGIYGWGMDGSYNWNGAAGKIDEVLFKLLTSGAQNVQVVPGGGTVSADNPIYRGNAIIKSISISVPHDGVVTSKASFTGDGVITRLTSGSF